MPTKWTISTTLSLMVAVCQRTIAYSDLRNTPCMHPDMMAVPTERGQWLGYIQMTMTCDPEYDFPLNAPPNGVFTCMPDASPWQPSFIPDCNDLIIPTHVHLLIFVSMGENQNCQPPSEVRFVKAAIENMDFEKKCRQMGLKSCTRDQVSYHCTIPNKGGDLWLSVSNYTRNFYFVIFTTKHNQAMTYSAYSNFLNTLSLPVPSSMGAPIKKIRLKCPKTTVGVARTTGNDDLVCRGCPMGHYLQGEQCVQCPPGYYADTTLRLECLKCPALKELPENDPLWKVVQRKVPPGSFGSMFCPSLRRKDGKLELVPSRYKLGYSLKYEALDTGPGSTDEMPTVKNQSSAIRTDMQLWWNCLAMAVGLVNVLSTV